MDYSKANIGGCFRAPCDRAEEGALAQLPREGRPQELEAAAAAGAGRGGEALGGRPPRHGRGCGR